MAKPVVQSITPNGGEGVFIAFNGLRTAVVPPSGSVVHHVAVTFDQPVTLGAGAVIITPHPGVQVLAGPRQPNQLAVTPIVTPLAGTNGRTWIVRFGGPGADQKSGNIKDGVYDVTVVAAQVTNAGGETMQTDAAATFHALYASRSLAAVTEVLVDAQAEAAWQQSFGVSIDYDPGEDPDAPRYKPEFDADLDGDINGTDQSRLLETRTTKWVY